MSFYDFGVSIDLSLLQNGAPDIRNPALRQVSTIEKALLKPTHRGFAIRSRAAVHPAHLEINSSPDLANAWGASARRSFILGTWMKSDLQS